MRKVAPKILKQKFSTFSVILLFIIVFLSYGQTINMFFWIDDWGMLFNMIHPTVFEGNFGVPAYRYNTTPFVLLYPLIGLNARIYFELGVVQYFIAALAVLIFTRELTKNKLISLTSAVIFSSGYIGSYAMYRLSNSYQLVDTTIFIIFTAWALHVYHRTQKNKYYLFSLFLFTITLEFFFLRTTGILIIVFALSALFGSYKLNKTSILMFFVRQIPFFVVYYFFYFIDSRVTIDGNSSSKDAMRRSSEIILEEKHLELINNLIISITNTIIPDKLTQFMYDQLTGLVPYLEKNIEFIIAGPFFVVTIGVFLYWFITKRNLTISILILIFLLLCGTFVFWSSIQENIFWNPRKIELFTSALGISFIGFSIWLYFIFKNKEKEISKLLILGLVWIFAIVIGYYIYSPTTSLDSQSRYLIPGFVGSILFYVSFLYLLIKLIISRKRPSMILMLVIIFALSGLLIRYSRQEQAQIISTISNPARTEFKTLQKEIGNKNVGNNTVFHFETFDDPILRSHILGGMPYLAVAIASGSNIGATIADSYEHLIYLLSTKNGNVENSFTFFANQTSMVSTTNLFRNLLNKTSFEQRLVDWQANTRVLENKNITTQTVFITNKIGTIGINPVLEVNTEHPSLVPSELKITMSISPLSVENQIFPYFDYTKKIAGRNDFFSLEKENIIDNSDVSSEYLLPILTIEKDKFDMRFAHVLATSSGRSTEEQYLTDGRPDTYWAAESNIWNRGELPQILSIDLGKNKQVDTLTWVNHHTFSTPTVYTVEHSDDKKTWIKSNEISDKQQLLGGKTVSLNLGNVNARYFKISIYDTYRGPGYPPAIDELWVSNGNINLDSEIINKIRDCPFCIVDDNIQYKKITELVRNVSEAKIFWTTDRNEKYRNEYNRSVLLNLDGKPHTYKIILPPQGTHYHKLKIDDFKVPLKVVLYEASLRSLSLNELKERNLITQFAK